MSSHRNYHYLWTHSSGCNDSFVASHAASKVVEQSARCYHPPRNEAFYNRYIPDHRAVCVAGDGSKRHRVDSRKKYTRLSGYNNYP